MAFNKKIETDKAKTINTGFGTNAANYGGRLLNQDGTPNIEKRGLSFFARVSWFHSLLFYYFIFLYLSQPFLYCYLLFYRCRALSRT